MTVLPAPAPSILTSARRSRLSASWSFVKRGSELWRVRRYVPAGRTMRSSVPRVPLTLQPPTPSARPSLTVTTASRSEHLSLGTRSSSSSVVVTSMVAASTVAARPQAATQASASSAVRVAARLLSARGQERARGAAPERGPGRIVRDGVIRSSWQQLGQGAVTPASPGERLLLQEVHQRPFEPGVREDVVMRGARQHGQARAREALAAQAAVAPAAAHEGERLGRVRRREAVAVAERDEHGHVQPPHPVAPVVLVAAQQPAQLVEQGR